MNCLKTATLLICVVLSATANAQIEKRKLAIKRTHSPIKIDGVLDEPAWKDAPLADKFVEAQARSFQKRIPR